MTTQERAALVTLAHTLNDAVTTWTRTKTDVRERFDVILAALAALPSGGAEGPTREQVEALPRYRDVEVHPNDPGLPVYTEIRQTPDGCWVEVSAVLALYAEPAKEPV